VAEQSWARATPDESYVAEAMTTRVAVPKTKAIIRRSAKTPRLDRK
jgi:hypothetical protein